MKEEKPSQTAPSEAAVKKKIAPLQEPGKEEVSAKPIERDSIKGKVPPKSDT